MGEQWQEQLLGPSGVVGLIEHEAIDCDGLGVLFGVGGIASIGLELFDRIGVIFVHVGDGVGDGAISLFDVIGGALFPELGHAQRL